MYSNLTVNLLRQCTHKPEEKHVDGHASRSKDGGQNTRSPHRRDPPYEGNDDKGILPMSGDAPVAVAVVEETGKLETRQHDQARRIDECKQQAKSAEKGGDETCYVLHGERGGRLGF